MRTSGFFISLLLTLASPTLLAQSRFLPSAIRLGTDLTDLLHSAFDEKATKYQILGDFDVNKFFVVGEYGNYRTITYENYRYDNQGSFYRLGIDYNILNRSIENNVMYVGFRYARSRFDDQTTFFIVDPTWGTQQVVVGNEGVTARWFEITSGIKVHIWNSIYMGYTFRVKLGVKQEGVGTADTFSVPGFGRTDDGTSVGLNYQIFYRIPFRKKTIQPKQRKS